MAGLIVTRSKLNVGDVFGRLRVEGVPFRVRKSGRPRTCVVCRCECGSYLAVSIDNLRRDTKSCGCLMREVASRRMQRLGAEFGRQSRRHGETGTRLHCIWLGMKTRCGNARRHNYQWYGGKGVQVCEEWQKSYERFRDWALANGYSEELTIDRIEPAGDYCPSNCRWITASENVLRSNTRHRMGA